MAHAQKPDFVFPRNGRVHLNRWGCQFSRMLAAEVCASASVMLDRPRSEETWEYWLLTPFASFPFTSPTVRHRVPSSSERALLYYRHRVTTQLQMRVGGSVKTQLSCDRNLLVWRWLHVSSVLAHLQVISCFTTNNNKEKIYTLDNVYLEELHVY